MATYKGNLPEISDAKPVLIVTTNTDLTEGKGTSKTLAVTESRGAAIRLGHKKHVMGSNCPIHDGMAYKIGNRWYYPVDIETPSQRDQEFDKKYQEREAIMEKTKTGPISPEELAVISAGPVVHHGLKE